MKLTANIESVNDCYVGWIESIKGLVVESDSLEGVLEELMISLKVKIAYALGTEIDNIGFKQFATKQEFEEFRKSMELSNGKGTRDINLDMNYA